MLGELLCLRSECVLSLPTATSHTSAAAGYKQGDDSGMQVRGRAPAYSAWERRCHAPVASMPSGAASNAAVVRTARTCPEHVTPLCKHVPTSHRVQVEVVHRGRVRLKGVSQTINGAPGLRWAGDEMCHACYEPGAQQSAAASCAASGTCCPSTCSQG